jgi:hypothetical protein
MSLFMGNDSVFLFFLTHKWGVAYIPSGGKKGIPVKKRGKQRRII